MTTTTLMINGMTCSHCVMAVQKALGKLPDVMVKEVRIGSASVEFDEAKVKLNQIEAVMEKAGYAVAHPQDGKP